MLICYSHAHIIFQYIRVEAHYDHLPHSRDYAPASTEMSTFLQTHLIRDLSVIVTLLLVAPQLLMLIIHSET